MLAKLKTFFQSPLNQTGFITFISSLAGIAVYFVNHSVGDATLAASTVFGALHIIWPDNAATAQSIDKLVADGIAASTAKTPAAIGTVVGDVTTIIHSATETGVKQ